MKKKITISLDENILKQIDTSVTKGTEKNRSYVIEKILSEKYGNANNISVIIFAHDAKWDNREYPFQTPKSLLEINKKPIIIRQIEMFQKYSINSFSISIPTGKTIDFQNTIGKYFPDLTVRYIELDKKTQTGKALDTLLKSGDFHENIIISNGDIYYGSLDIENYYKYHKAQKGDFSFALKFVMNPEQLGNVAIDGNKILEFVEKPKARASYLTSCGMYITTKKFLESHKLGEHLEDDFFPKVPDLGNTIGFIYAGQWEHIQNDSAYERADGQLL